MSEPAGLYRKFDAGPVRVALWESQDAGHSLFLTVERGRPGLHGLAVYGPVLEPQDVAKAILALKKANDFLTNPEKLAWPEDAGGQRARWPERLP